MGIADTVPDTKQRGAALSSDIIGKMSGEWNTQSEILNGV